jgi:hypothetical protein
VGATFSVPLADGRFGACRVLRIRRPAKDILASLDLGMSLFAATEYIDAKPPRISDSRLRSILVLNYFWFDKQRCIQWQYWGHPPPRNFHLIGHIEPSPAEERLDLDAYGKFWEHWGEKTLGERRWQHDRKAFLRDYDKQYGPGASERLLEEKKQRASMTLEKLYKVRFFANWEEFVSPSAVRESRKIIRDTIGALIRLGKPLTKKSASPILKECTEQFNRLDQKRQFITTIEREDICEVIDRIIHVARLRGCDTLVDQWRDW